MASTDSFASWHPAFRPNTLPPDVPSTSEPSAIESDPTLVDTLPSETSFEALTKEDVTSQHVDAWFSDDVDTQNEDWLAGSQEVPAEESLESQPWEVAESDALEASEPQPVEPQLDSDAPELHTREPAPEGVVTEESNLDATSDGSAPGAETVTDATHQYEIPVLPSQGLHTEEPISDDPPVGVTAEMITEVTASESSISQEPESASQDPANNTSAEHVLTKEPERSIAPVVEQPVSGESTMQVAPDTGGEHFDTPVPEAEPERESSKQLSWEDGDAGADEGAEWFLDRSDSNDPSKFLPPSERSNSFPVVPPLDSPASPSKSYLPRTQAENLLQEEDVEGEAFFANAGSTNEDTATTRYEEGMPLISQASTQASPPNGEAPASSADDAFADEDDDFFSNVVQGGGDEGLKVASEPWPLDRKSTFQAMGPRSTVSAETSSVVDTVSSHNPPEAVERPANHDEANSGETKGAVNPSDHATETSWSNEAAPAPEEDALAAKWSEAFGDDELLDDDFLGDDAAGSKEMDPAAFFGSDDEGFLDDVEESEQPAPAPVAQPTAVPSPTTQSSAQSRYAPQTLPATTALQNAAVNPYAPAVPAVPANPYHAAAAPAVQPPTGYSATAPPQTTPYGVAPPPAPPSLNKAQSFADKAKGGYTSPYDLPMNVVDVKPRKRPSMQQLPSTTSIPPVGPPRSSSMYAQSPTGPPTSNTSPPVSAGVAGPSPLERTPSLPPKSKENFFEDLPLTSRPRPASRQNHTSSPGPMGQPHGPPPPHPGPPVSNRASSLSAGPPTGPHPGLPPASRSASLPTSPPLGPPHSHSMYAPVPPQMPNAVSDAGLAPAAHVNPYAPPPPTATIPQSGPIDPTGVPNLVKPATVNPYAPVPSQSHSAPPVSAPAAASRYSPVQNQPTPHLNGAPPPAAASNRYSSPAGSRQPSANYAAPPPAVHPATILPHQPRTSSPLAHFEKTASRTNVNGEATHGDRRTSLPHEARLHRLASLTPTREVEEEQEQSPPKPPQTASAAAASIAESRYSPVSVPGPRSTPPPMQPNLMQTSLSPPKRSQYAPLAAQSPRAKEHDVVPPPRSFSQSPNSQRLGLNGPAPYESPQRSVSAQAPVSPKSSQPVAPAYVPTHRARAPSLAMNMVPPTDGRENDPLQRWKGAPLFVWGVGGTVVSMFPKSVPRYGISQTAPMIYRTPGEVKIQHVKDVIPLEERLAKFPGPLKGKSKKKETLAWLSAGIDSLSTAAPDLAFNQTPSHEEKRSAERLLLWKTLRVLIENDGVLEGNPAVQKAVRDILMPNLDEEISPAGTSLDGVADLGALHQPGMGSVQPDALDAAGIELLRRHLLVGDREKAAWAAVDKRLWGHAMLIANTVSPELYKQVTQEFVRKEVNYAGHNNESIAALYKVLSGNHDECVDELVPVHARAGLQLMAATTAATSMTGSLGGLDKWRESLCLILSNRSTDDSKALIALGGLLSNYGRAEAAHICFIFARQASVFSGADDPRSNFVLVGSDHRGQADRFAKDIEAILLSEVYEYGLSLAGGPAPLAPHLTGYKLQLAVTLAEYGQRDKALQYCEGALNTIGSQTKRSPYHHPALEQAMEDFVKRLKQTPREESNSWIPKPSMNKVSDTMWSTFNKFVSGEDNDSPRNGANGDEGVESGPFAKIAGGTPTISRSPSTSNFEPYGTNHAGYPVSHVPPPMSAPGFTAAPPAASRSASRYAPFPPQGSAPPAMTNPYEPAVAYTPRSSSEGTRHANPYEPSRSRPSTGYQPQPQQQYNPAPAAQQGYQPSAPAPQESSYPVPAQSEPLAYPAQAPPAPSSGYSPLGLQESSYNPSPAQEPAEENVSSEDQAQQGYQPPSYGYEPPSFTPMASDVTNGATEAENTGDANTSSGGGYEPPSYQSYGYEPPSYGAEPEASDDEPTVPKKKGPMYDDEDDGISAPTPQEKSKAEKDRENEEMVRRVAEEEEKRAAEKAAAKKGWGFGGWFGASKKEPSPAEHPNKPVKANLGEQSSFVYDPELKRWINKKAGAENTEAKKAAPPPPKGPPRSANSTPPPRTDAGTPPPLSGLGRASAPPGGPPRPGTATGVGESTLSSHDGLGIPTPMARSVSNQSAGGPPSGPPSRPTTSMSNASSIDDLIGAAAPRKHGQKKARKSGRYVDVMAQ